MSAIDETKEPLGVRVVYMPCKDCGGFARHICTTREASAPAAPPDTRERLARAVWYAEMEENNRRDQINKRPPVKYAEWPEGSAKQPYCQWAYREAESILATFPDMNLDGLYASPDAAPKDQTQAAIEEAPATPPTINPNAYEVIDCATGVKGTFCIMQKVWGAPAYVAFWNPSGWAGSGFVFHDKALAESIAELLRKAQKATNTASPTDEAPYCATSVDHVDRLTGEQAAIRLHNLERIEEAVRVKLVNTVYPMLHGRRFCTVQDAATTSCAIIDAILPILRSGK